MHPLVPKDRTAPQPRRHPPVRLPGRYPTRKQAETAVIRELQRRRHGATLDPHKLTVDQYLDRWLAHIQTTRRARPAEGPGRFLPACVTLIRRLRADPRVPWQAKAAVILAGFGLLSPIDLLPEFLPVIGPLDDVVVVPWPCATPPGGCPGEVLLEAWPGEPRLLERLIGIPDGAQHPAGPEAPSDEPDRPDAQRTRFRRPVGVAVMAYKAILGLSEITVGVLLAVPSVDPEATFARLSAEELREDPGDRLVALVRRHLPALLHHRGVVAVGLIVLGLAKLVAAASMWEGQEWGGTS